MPIHGYPGNVVTANPTSPTNTTASGVWTLEQQLQAQAAGNWPMAATQISRSLRFNSADSAYLNRTFGAGNQKTWTLSAWVKRSALGDNQIFSNYTSGTDVAWIYFNSSNELYFQNYEGSNQLELKTTQVFRDVGAWGHLIITLDTTQATSSNRAKLYWNGVQITALTTATYPSQNADLKINTSGETHEIGKASSTYFNGYLTEINFIDGQALTPNSFGFFDNDGIWTPKQYTGPYGTNGFYLTFSDNSDTTATTLGKDYSGNGNNWTLNNFSVTAGAGNDSLVDSPTRYGTDTGAGGEVRGNYCTLNPLHIGASSSLANGNLDFTSTSSAGSVQQSQITGTIGIPSSGKWYFESTPTSLPVSIYIGVASTTHPMSSSPFSGTPIRTYRSSTGNKSNGGTDSAYGNTYTTNDVIGVAVDMDTGSIFFYKNGTVQNSGTAAFTDLVGTTWTPYCVAGSSGATVAGNFNFGQRPFAYTAPSGFKALVTTNLPTPTIEDGSEYFDVSLYTGNATARTITNSGGFQPDFVWIKNRSDGSFWHQLYDVLRGALKGLFSNDTSVESTYTDTLTSFVSNGFTLGTDATFNGGVNKSGDAYVAWQWKANGSGVSNTDGTITSTVSVNTTSGFSIVTYTGTGANATVGHGLGVAPSMIICKNRDVARGWAVYHVSLGNTKNILLNSTGAANTASVYWNDTSPTSSVFSVGSDEGANESGSGIVAYCFAPVAGYSAFGSYTGNGSADGPFVFTGFRPRYVMYKRTDSTGDWAILDTSRDPYNVEQTRLFANNSNADTGSVTSLDGLSNGFKLRTDAGSANGSGATYIYMAFAENPFKLALAR